MGVFRPIRVPEPDELETLGLKKNLVQKSVEKRPLEYVWVTIVALAVLHAGAVYGVWLVVSGRAMLKTFVYGTKGLRTTSISINQLLNSLTQLTLLDTYFYSVTNHTQPCMGLVLITIFLIGITAGVHRLWCHRAYKAKWQLRLLLMILNTMSYEDSIIHWSRDHRTHHKY